MAKESSFLHQKSVGNLGGQRFWEAGEELAKVSKMKPVLWLFGQILEPFVEGVLICNNSINEIK